MLFKFDLQNLTDDVINMSRAGLGLGLLADKSPGKSDFMDSI